MSKLRNYFLISINYFYYWLFLNTSKTLQIVVQFLMKDIFGINMPKKTEQKWGTPIYIQLAIIKMESGFDWLAKPPRQKLFKIIPYKRPSSSFGYSQAVKGTWEQYKNETGNKLATRTRFKDSVDFIGWYTDKTESLLKISKNDAFRQYLAYHEGWGGYKNYKNNQKVIGLAKKVEKQSNKYKSQLQDCQKRLNKNKYIIF